jgi:hypothetical protein
MRIGWLSKPNKACTGRRLKSAPTCAARREAVRLQKRSLQKDIITWVFTEYEKGLINQPLFFIFRFAM